MDTARARAETEAYDKRHAELARDQEAANRAAGMFSPIGHGPLTREARDMAARESAPRDAAARESAAKDAAGQDHRPGAAHAQAPEQAGQHRAGEPGSDLRAGRQAGHRAESGAGDQDHGGRAGRAGQGDQRDQGDSSRSGPPGEDRDARAGGPGYGTRDAPGAPEAREASLEERMAKLIDDRVQAATDGLKTGYEAKLEAMRAELDKAEASREDELSRMKAELDDVHADLDSMKAVSRIAAERLQAEREAHTRQLDSLQAEHRREIDSLKAQLDAVKTGQPGEVRPGETRHPDSKSPAIADRKGTDQESDTVLAEPTEGTRWRRAITSENVGLAGTVLGAADTVAQFAMHATPDGVVGLGVMALGLASVALGRAEKHRNRKGKA